MNVAGRAQAFISKILRLGRQSVASRDLRADAFRAAVRSLDPGVVGAAAVAWLKDDWDCENVVWFPRGVLAQELAHYDRGRNEVALRYGATRGAVVSAEALLPGAVGRMFATWTPRALSDVLGDEGAVDCRERSDGRRDVRVTLGAPGGQNRPLGDMVFVGARCWERSFRLPLFERQMESLADRMDQALEHEAVRALTYKDELTDLFNQRYLPLVLEEQIQRASRGEGQFSVLFVDVDRFKSVNDENGHLVGSKVLIELSQILKSAVRRTDFAFRYGGDEYIVVLPGASAEGAFIAAERIRKRAESASFGASDDTGDGNDFSGDSLEANLNRRLNVTVSIGVAAYPQHAQSTRDLLRLADEAMYESKRQSRNAVRLAS